MIRSFFYLAFLMIWILCSLRAVSAQQVQDTEGSLLPDINPQDIEIRSQYQARFPGLRRQPILGFNPRPRVYQVDPNRTPYLESYEEIIAQLPVGEISRPAPPEYLSPLFPDPKHGYGHLGAGSYLTPESGMAANAEIGENHWLTGNLDYRSSAGHLEEPATSFRFLNLETGYRGKLDPATVLGMTLGANSDFNRMFELSPSVMDRMDGTARKEYRGLNLDTRITRFKNKIESWNVGIGGMYQAMDLDAGNVTPLTSDIDEWGITLDANKNWIGERLHEQYGVQADVQTGGYQSSGLNGSQFWHMAGAGGRYEQLFDYKTKVDASLMVYHVSDAVDQTFYVSPDLNVEFYLMDEVTFTGSVSGNPEHPRHISYHRENRFLIPDNLLRHSYHLKGSAGISVEFYPGNKLSGGISYQDSKNYPYYTRQDLSSVLSGGDSGYYQIQYGRASVYKIHGGYSADLIPGQLWVNLNAWWQDPKLTEEDIKVPFEENLGLHGAVTVRPVQQLLFEAWGDFTGTRTAPGVPDLNPFIHVGSRVEVRVGEKVGIYGKILNLLNQSYEIWEGYPERPFQVYGGVSLIF